MYVCMHACTNDSKTKLANNAHLSFILKRHSCALTRPTAYLQGRKASHGTDDFSNHSSYKELEQAAIIFCCL